MYGYRDQTPTCSLTLHLLAGALQQFTQDLLVLHHVVNVILEVKLAFTVTRRDMDAQAG